jgi:ribosomal protein S18 acetylase RimI-like enzyme
VAPEALIRRATAEDLDACLRLFDVLSELQAPMWGFEVWPEVRDRVADRYRRLVHEPEAIHLVAQAGPDVVGMGVGEVVRASRVSDERALEVSNVAVLASHRRQGIARALVEGLAAFARERGVPWLALRTFAANEPALRFWEGLGFAPRVVQLVAPAADIAP